MEYKEHIKEQCFYTSNAYTYSGATFTFSERTVFRKQF